MMVVLSQMAESASYVLVAGLPNLYEYNAVISSFIDFRRLALVSFPFLEIMRRPANDY